jgi:DNA-binding MarR family transcriptional regulator
MESIVVLVVDAIIDADEDAIQFAAPKLYDLASSSKDPVLQARIETLAMVSEWAEDRLSSANGSPFEPGSHSEKMLIFIGDEPGVSNDELAARMGVDKSVVSRRASELSESGLAVSRKLGRRHCWELTSRGQRLMESLATPQAALESKQVWGDPDGDVERALEKSATLLTWATDRIQAASQGSARSAHRSDASEVLELVFQSHSGSPLAPKVSRMRALITPTDGEPQELTDTAEIGVQLQRVGTRFTVKASVGELPEAAAIRTLIVGLEADKWAVRWSEGRRALRRFDALEEALAYARGRIATQEPDMMPRLEISAGE